MALVISYGRRGLTARAVSQKDFASFGTSAMSVLMIEPGMTVFESLRGIMNLKNPLPKSKNPDLEETSHRDYPIFSSGRLCSLAAAARKIERSPRRNRIYIVLIHQIKAQIRLDRAKCFRTTDESSKRPLVSRFTFAN